MVPALPVVDKGVISVHRRGSELPVAHLYGVHPPPPWPLGPRAAMVESRFHDLRGHGLGLSPMQIRCGVLWM